MQVTQEQRRTLIALACRVAWADGVVEFEERAFIQDLVRRLGGPALEPGELEAWLDRGPPKTEIDALPPQLGQFFFYEALKLAESDGDLDPREQEMVEDILSRFFKQLEDDQGQGTPLARLGAKKA